jgi:acetoacetate decarboxylase
MNLDEVRKTAFAMPLTSPAFPPAPYRFFNREFFIITYRTDRDALERVVLEPLTVTKPIVKYEFIRMPDSTGFGDYCESGQVIPVSFNGKNGQYTHAMFLNDGPRIYGGRELWEFPRKFAEPEPHVERDALVGSLDYSPVRVARGVMGYKHKQLDHDAILEAFAAPNYLLKIIPHVAGSPRILELIDYRLEDIVLKSAYTGPASLALQPHALAPVADLPVREIVSAAHIVADLALGLGKVVYDYLRS